MSDNNIVWMLENLFQHEDFRHYERVDEDFSLLILDYYSSRYYKFWSSEQRGFGVIFGKPLDKLQDSYFHPIYLAIATASEGYSEIASEEEINELIPELAAAKQQFYKSMFEQISIITNLVREMVYIICDYTSTEKEGMEFLDLNDAVTLAWNYGGDDPHTTLTDRIVCEFQ